MDARLAEYVRGQWPALVHYATLLCGDDGEAEEVVQATLTRVALRWRFVQDKSNPDGYVRRALIRACIASGKPRRREPVLDDIAGVVDVERSRQVDDSEMVRRALATLPPRQRAVLVLRYLDDASDATTADQLGCSVGTVRSQAAKGLARVGVLMNVPAGDGLQAPVTEIEERLRAALASAPRPVTRTAAPMAEMDRRLRRLRVRRAALAVVCLAVAAAVAIPLSHVRRHPPDRGAPAPHQVEPWPAHHLVDFASATAGGGFVWSTEQRAGKRGEISQVDRRDPRTGRVLQSFPVPAPERFVSYGLDRLWVWGGGDGVYPVGRLSVLDPTSGDLRSANLGREKGLAEFGVADDNAIAFGSQIAFGARESGGDVIAFDPAHPADLQQSVARLPGAVSLLSGQGMLIVRSHLGVVGQYPLAGGWPPAQPSEPITLRGYPLTAAPTGFWLWPAAGCCSRTSTGSRSAPRWVCRNRRQARVRR